jgi:glycosyltransferase involved in cell wall biosynthesis
LRAQAIPNTVDTTHFTFRQRLPLRPHLVCTRGFNPYYCIDVVVKAFAEVRKVFPAAQLDLVGRGPLEPQIRTLVSELNIEGVNFCGTAARNEIAEYYKRADIFINASRVDNMPVSVLEAFASGTPVVSTGPESMRYLVEHGRTGLLSKPGDAEALAQNVIRILRDSDLAQRLISNALLESRKYEWANVRDRWLQIYRELGNVNFPVNEFDRAISSNGVSD